MFSFIKVVIVSLPSKPCHDFHIVCFLKSLGRPPNLLCCIDRAEELRLLQPDPATEQFPMLESSKLVITSSGTGWQYHRWYEVWVFNPKEAYWAWFLSLKFKFPFLFLAGGTRCSHLSLTWVHVGMPEVTGFTRGKTLEIVGLVSHPLETLMCWAIAQLARLTGQLYTWWSAWCFAGFSGWSGWEPGGLVGEACDWGSRL